MCALCEAGHDCPRHPREGALYFLEESPREREEQQRDRERSTVDFREPFEGRQS
jgi:hypothetical protein